MEYTDPHPDLKGEDVITEGCGKCMGTGAITWGNVQYSMRHSDGTYTTDRYCFDCNGSGVLRRKVKNIRSQARRLVKTTNSEEARVADYIANEAKYVAAEKVRRDNQSDAFVAAWPEAAAKVAELKGDFGDAMRLQLAEEGTLTDGQLAAVNRIVEESKSDPTPAPVIEGRIVLTGRVVCVKLQESVYGTTVKMIVLDDRGFKVWGTMPKALEEDNVSKGDRVTFTGTVGVSDDDETFGFYVRPSKPSRCQ